MLVDRSAVSVEYKFSTDGSTLTATRRVTIAVSDGAGGSKTASINIAVSR